MPIALTCSGCGRSYLLRDELAGRKVRCPGCASVQVVPEPAVEEGLSSPDTEDGDSEGLHRAFDRDRFLFRQKLMTLSEKYEVWDDEGRPILFIERPAHVGRQLLALMGTIGVFLVTFALAILAMVTLADKGPVSAPVAALCVLPSPSASSCP